MRVFMLGWEFPPFISGGLGTACYGLTKAMSKQNIDVLFVLPKSIGSEYSSHVKLLSPQAPKAAQGDRSAQSVASTYQVQYGEPGAMRHVTFKAVPSRMVSPYQSTGGKFHAPQVITEEYDRPISVLSGSPVESTEPLPIGVPAPSQSPPTPGSDYSGDLMAETRRYASLCVDLARGEEFDVIHAHDWMTYPAGLAVSAVTGKPLVVHVHSTEFDRSGEHVNQVVYDIERRGMHGAMRVICVSHLTGSIVHHRYGVSEDKIDVVYNGIENGSNGMVPVAPRTAIRKGDKIVLFLGRITMQKGPEYFIAAAKKVLEKYDKVKFVVAGSGDQIRPVIELAASAGIGQKVLFTGFLRGDDVRNIFEMADVYVMPSVSEPFGIAPLEAISHDVPVIISKTSGVSEVLQNALKVDFWDIDEMANKIIAVLRHPPLSSTLREHADMEVRKLTWDGAAAKCHEVYENAVAALT